MGKGKSPLMTWGSKMTIDKVSNQKTQELEKTPLTVQNELQKDVLKQTVSTTSGMQKELLQMMQSAPPEKVLQRTAQDQLKRGYLDIKV
jgi:hypothetical protein